MSEDFSDTAVAELICTRLSHDIIGNIGAVANAVELLEEGDMDFMDDIKSILKTSSAVLASRLKFFRMAFGLDNANLENFELLEKTMRDYLATLGNKNYPTELSVGLSDARYSRAVLLAVMIIADTLIRGGKITVVSDGKRLRVQSEPAVTPPADKVEQIKNILAGKACDLNAQFAPLYFLLKFLKQENINLYILNSPALGFVFE